MQPAAERKVRRLQYGPATEAPLSDPAHTDPFLHGIEQFNTGRFFEAHETWEELWLRSPEPDKTFLQGIIQIAAAFHHYSRGNTRGAKNLLRAGLQRLNNFPDAHHAIALSSLRAQAQSWLAALAAGKPPHQSLPQIKFLQDH